jgi:hypothetical protein
VVGLGNLHVVARQVRDRGLDRRAEGLDASPEVRCLQDWRVLREFAEGLLGFVVEPGRADHAGDAGLGGDRDVVLTARGSGEVHDCVGVVVGEESVELAGGFDRNARDRFGGVTWRVAVDRERGFNVGAEICGVEDRAAHLAGRAGDCD